MADKTTPHGDHIAGDKIGRDKIDTQINHYHRHYYGADKQREHELHRLYLRGLFQKTWAEVSLAEFGTENVWSAARLQGKTEGEKTSLRKCIRPLMEISSPGHDELRACLSL